MSALSIDEKSKFIADHLSYEFGMFRWAARILCGEDFGGLSQESKNAAIEVFCLHGRNLIEFFSSTHKETRNSWAAAQHFTLKGYRPKKFDQALATRLNSFVSHLSYRRTSVGDRLGSKDYTEIAAFIEQEMSGFYEHLRPEIGNYVAILSSAKPKVASC